MYILGHSKKLRSEKQQSNPPASSHSGFIDYCCFLADKSTEMSTSSFHEKTEWCLKSPKNRANRGTDFELEWTRTELYLHRKNKSANKHKMTDNFIKIMYSMSLYPKRTRPTRITLDCATLMYLLMILWVILLVEN